MRNVDPEGKVKVTGDQFPEGAVIATIITRLSRRLSQGFQMLRSQQKERIERNGLYLKEVRVDAEKHSAAI